MTTLRRKRTKRRYMKRKKKVALVKKQPLQVPFQWTPTDKHWRSVL